jgi:hypothetical protein
MNEPARILDQVVTAARHAEEAARQALEASREGTQANRELIAALAEVVGWSPAFYGVIAAEGKRVAGAETAFAAAVEEREAVERLRDELRDR